MYHPENNTCLDGLLFFKRKRTTFRVFSDGVILKTLFSLLFRQIEKKEKKNTTRYQLSLPHAIEVSGSSTEAQ